MNTKVFCFPVLNAPPAPPSLQGVAWCLIQLEGFTMLRLPPSSLSWWSLQSPGCQWNKHLMKVPPNGWDVFPTSLARPLAWLASAHVLQPRRLVSVSPPFSFVLLDGFDGLCLSRPPKLWSKFQQDETSCWWTCPSQETIFLWTRLFRKPESCMCLYDLGIYGVYTVSNGFVLVAFLCLWRSVMTPICSQKHDAHEEPFFLFTFF